jgi:hypothetical protein
MFKHSPGALGQTSDRKVVSRTQPTGERENVIYLTLFKGQSKVNLAAYDAGVTFRPSLRAVKDFHWSSTRRSVTLISFRM